jgi:hypothetical protein
MPLILMMVVSMENIKKQNGQALFEFIFFMPFMLLLVTLFLTFGGAINGSINQQKATRGYFYALAMNNSTTPTLDILDSLKGLDSIGSSVIGWTREEVNAGKPNPVAPCYKLSTFMTSGPGDKCDDPRDPATRATNFVRVYTAYGVCGAGYRKENGNFVYDVLNQSRGATDCSIK